MNVQDEGARVEPFGAAIERQQSYEGGGREEEAKECVRNPSRSAKGEPWRAEEGVGERGTKGDRQGIQTPTDVGPREGRPKDGTLIEQRFADPGDWQPNSASLLAAWGSARRRGRIGKKDKVDEGGWSKRVQPRTTAAAGGRDTRSRVVCRGALAGRSVGSVLSPT